MSAKKWFIRPKWVKYYFSYQSVWHALKHRSSPVLAAAHNILKETEDKVSLLRDIGRPLRYYWQSFEHFLQSWWEWLLQGWRWCLIISRTEENQWCIWGRWRIQPEHFACWTQILQVLQYKMYTISKKVLNWAKVAQHCKYKGLHKEFSSRFGQAVRTQVFF